MMGRDTLVDIIEFQYGCNSVVLFKCEWYDNIRGVRVIQSHGFVEVNHTTQLAQPDVHLLAQQTQEVYYMLYPSARHGWANWMVACKVWYRHSFNVSENVDSDMLEDDEGAST